MSNCRFPISNWVRGVRESLPPKDLRIQGSSRNVPIRSRTFRNFPFRSVLFRPVPVLSGTVRSPSASRSGFAVLLQVNALPLLFALLAQFAAKNKEGIDTHGLTDFRAVAKRSISFRNFPKLSETFRFVSFCSARSGGFRGVAAAGEAGRIRPEAWRMRPETIECPAYAFGV